MPRSLISFVPRRFIFALLALVLGFSSLCEAQARPVIEQHEQPNGWQVVRRPLNEALNYCYLGMAGTTGTRVATAADVINVTCRTKLANQTFFEFALLPTEITLPNNPSQLVPNQRQALQQASLEKVFLNRSLASITQAKEQFNQTAVYLATGIRKVTNATHRESQKVLTQLANGMNWITALRTSPNRVANQANQANQAIRTIGITTETVSTGTLF